MSGAGRALGKDGKSTTVVPGPRDVYAVSPNDGDSLAENLYTRRSVLRGHSQCQRSIPAVAVTCPVR
jgi:hypothetical protein